MPIGQWLQQYASVLVAAGNLLLVVIWGIYLQMFYRRTERQQEPTLLLHRAQGPAASSTCLLVNMSKEVVHVECVIVEIETDQETRVHQITDYQRIPADETQAQERLRQGPLRPGEFLLLGRLENVLPEFQPPQEEQEGSALPPAASDVRALELRAVAFHGPTNDLVGARRRFIVEHQENGMRVRPDGLLTDQLTSRRERSKLRRWLRDSLAQASDQDWPEPSQRERGLSP